MTKRNKAAPTRKKAKSARKIEPMTFLAMVEELKMLTNIALELAGCMQDFAGRVAERERTRWKPCD